MKQVTDFDIEAASMAWNDFGGSDAFATHLKQIATVNDAARVETSARWAWLFAEDGFWTLTTGHKYAAALMATNTSGLKGEIILPARALRVLLPPGSFRGERNDYRVIYLMVDQQDAWLEIATCSQFGHNEFIHSQVEYDTVGVHAQDAESLLFQVDDDTSDLTAVSHKTMILLRRLVVGLLYAFQNMTRFKETPGGGHRGARFNRSGPPKHRVVFVGKPLQIDVRDQIAEWLKSPVRFSRPPSFQHVVRGHYKRQVVGLSRAGRKIIWVEPYWRGPEDAPILVRPYQIGAS